MQPKLPPNVLTTFAPILKSSLFSLRSDTDKHFILTEATLKMAKSRNKAFFPFSFSSAIKHSKSFLAVWQVQTSLNWMSELGQHVGYNLWRNAKAKQQIFVRALKNDTCFLAKRQFLKEQTPSAACNMQLFIKLADMDVKRGENERNDRRACVASSV